MEPEGKSLLKSGCYQGGVKVLDEALNVLDELGVLKITINERKDKIVYGFVEARSRIVEEGDNLSTG